MAALSISRRSRHVSAHVQDSIMTVAVMLPDGGTDKSRRCGDAYAMSNDGTLDVNRSGAKQPHG
jgi:hypothetical protein